MEHANKYNKKEFICVPFEHVFSSCNVSAVGPYSFLFYKMCNV